MLSPEAWRFASPFLPENIDVVSESFTGKQVKKFTFVNCISIICPDLYRIPEEWLKLFTKNQYYEVFNCPLTCLIDPEFIEFFIAKGKLQCLSTGCEDDVTIAINSNGIFTLHVSKEIYEILGLNAKKKNIGSAIIYEISINLKSNQLKQRKLFNRIKSAFRKLRNIDLVLNWEPHDINICPSSIAKYFDKEMTVLLKNIKVDMNTYQCPCVPQLEKDYVKEILEWTGLMLIGGDVKSESDYVSSFSYSGPSIKMCENVSTVVAYGLFSESAINEFFQLIRNYIMKRDSTLWVGLVLLDQRNGSSANFNAENQISSYFLTNKLSMTVTKKSAI